MNCRFQAVSLKLLNQLLEFRKMTANLLQCKSLDSLENWFAIFGPNPFNVNTISF